MFMDDDITTNGNGVGISGGGIGSNHQWIKTLTSSTPTSSFEKSLYQSNINLIDSNDLIGLDGSGNNNKNVGGIGVGGRNSNQKIMKQIFSQNNSNNINNISIDRMSDRGSAPTSSSTLSSSWIIRNCPPSLKFIAKFYQWCGFSFSGVVFVDNHNHQQHFRSTEQRKSGVSKIFNSMNNNGVVDHLNQHQSQQWQSGNKNPRNPFTTNQNSKIKDKDEQRFGLRLRRYFFLGLNLASLTWMILFLSAIIFDKWNNSSLISDDDNEDLDPNTNNETATANQTTELVLKNQDNDTDLINETTDNKTDSIREFLQIISNINPSHNDINQLKPILRAIIESLLYGVLLDTIVMIFYLLIRGGKLLKLLIQIPNIDLFDHSKQYAYKALGITLILSTIINTLGLLSFNTGAVEELLDSKIDVWIKLKILLQLWSNIWLFVYLSIVSILFIYTMMLFKFTINKLLQTFASINLDEIHMLKLKTKLSNLNDQFKEIIPYFALPLTVTFASNIFIIISSACFLMINTTRNQYTSFVFSLGLFAFLRLIIVACVGNLPTNICRDLIRTVYENLEQWSLNEWMCFMELKRLRKEFTVSIFSMYTVRQSSILAMLGFALNYIVILLQTENYSTTTTGSSTGSTMDNDSGSMVNDTMNMTKLMLLQQDDIDDANGNSAGIGRKILTTNPEQIMNWFD